MKHILVTGGAGFVGSNFIEYIFKNYEDYYILNLDKLTYAGNLDNIGKIEESRYHFCKGDIRDFKVVDNIFQKYPIDYVINFAAESHVDKSLKNPQKFLETNVLGVQNLLDVSLKYWKNNFDSLFAQVGVAILAAVLGYAVAGLFNDSVVSVAPVFWVLLGIGISINLRLSK